jgi:Tol biopolymer transport system component
MIEYIRWSPDGQRISFSVKRFTDSTLALWEVGADGTNAGPLFFGWPDPIKRFGEGECCSDWSPDGKYFLFRSHRSDAYSIWIFRAKQAPGPGHRIDPVRLYTSPSYTTQPRFSADGKKIFFVDHLERRELVRYDSARQMFVPYLRGIPARHLSFSRDAQWVAYRNEQDGTLWRERTDGTQAVQLTFPPLDTFHPTWSPDGQTIAFEGSGRLYTVPRDGGQPVPLLPEGTHDLQPNWSPDGRFIAFTLINPTVSQFIALLDLNTHQFKVVPNSDVFEDAQWSPDGKYLAAGSRNDQKLMLFDVAAQKWSPLADGLPYGWGIRWSHDSKYVYYQHPFNGEEQPIYRVHVSDRKVEQITTSRQILRADVLSYIMTGLTPDDSPLASLAHRNSDVYGLELDLP